MTTQRPILVFDVNETLLDLDHLGPVFQEIFGDRAVMRDWFAQLILYSQTLTLIGARENFAALAVSVLEMMGTIRGIAITDRDRAALARALGSLPAHPDAAEALDYLRDLGFRMVTLTNSPPSDGPSALDRAGLGGYFERSFSVAPTGGFKPAPQTYRLVAARSVSGGVPCLGHDGLAGHGRQGRACHPRRECTAAGPLRAAARSGRGRSVQPGAKDRRGLAGLIMAGPLS